MKITSLDPAKAVPVAMAGAKGVTRQVPISSADGSPLVSLRVFTLAPGGYTPCHEHAWEHLNYIMEGHGALVNGDGEEHELKPGDFALVLPDEKHQYVNRSTTAPFTMICGVPREYE